MSMINPNKTKAPGEILLEEIEKLRETYDNLTPRIRCMFGDEIADSIITAYVGDGLLARLAVLAKIGKDGESQETIDSVINYLVAYIEMEYISGDLIDILERNK